MRVLIAGGRGFLGRSLAGLLKSSGHRVRILTRSAPSDPEEIRWDGGSMGQWIRELNETDCVVNATGFGLEHWPWSAANKRRFRDSRVLPSRALTAGIMRAAEKPAVFIQFSGVNYYGLRGEIPADEGSPPGDDFLARLTVEWEAASEPLDDAGVRRLVVRNGIVLDARAGLFPLMVVPVRIFVGGPMGDGSQIVPWIHLRDHMRAVRFLMETLDAQGVYNLVSPSPLANADFMRAVASTLHRPYWLRAPSPLLKLVLGEMSKLILEGRACLPKRLEQSGFKFEFPTIATALQSLLDGN